MPNRPLIVVVGVCASGKSTLSLGLRELGYNVRNFAQEHSVSGRTWRRLEPDILIFLDCSFSTIKSRKVISWGPERYLQQQELLTDARQHATLVVNTDDFTPNQLIKYVNDKLNEMGIEDGSNTK